jgi:Protein of unknown function (DUF1552)
VTQRIDRRRFLIGSGGALFALPMLEAFAPRTAFAQTAAPPKRLVVVFHPHGRVVGPGSAENWAPLATTGNLPPVGTAPSGLLAALAPINDQIVTLGNIDNIVRHTSNDGDGHATPSATCMTCVVPSGQNPTGPSIDYVAGLRLRSSAAQRMAIVIPGQAAQFDNSVTQNNVFLGPGGTPGNYQSIDPVQLIKDLFASVQGSPPPPTPTLQDRLVARRGSILDAVAQGFTSFRARLNSADQARLDQHAQFIRDTELLYATPPPASSSASCSPPATSSVPNYDWSSFVHGEHDDAFAQTQIETLVQALACDVTRTASLYFWDAGSPGFVTEFAPTTSPYIAGNWHASIHGDGSPNDPSPADLTKGFGFYAKYYTKLIQRLAAVPDTDGSRLLDNTLVLWVSDLGYGSGHYCYNYPVVLAGMKSAFPKGQGRHVVGQVNSLGDLYAQVLRMLGGTDTTYGATGTLANAAKSTSINFYPLLGRPGLISKDTPLNFGPIDL